MRSIKILGVGKSLPERIVTAEEIDQRLGATPGWTMQKTAVAVRHFATHETTSQMGARAALEALSAAGLCPADVDCIVCTSAVGQQPIPATAVLIQRELGLADSGIPCFDINATCLSFIVGLDMMAQMVQAGRYRRVLLIAAEIASVGLDWDDHESAALFGDGAAAVVIGPAEPGESSAILGFRLETYAKGAHLSEIRGGGSGLHPREHSPATEKEFLFAMNGSAIFKMASQKLPAFMAKLLAEVGCELGDMDLVIPHQASAMAMRILQRKLGITEERFMRIVENHGNTIAASLPMGLYEGVRQGRIRRGDKVMMVGTAAGLSLGGLVLVY